MSREPVVVTLVVPFGDVDEAFDWWMRQYEKDPDGQFLDIARQLKPLVTTAAFESLRPQFEHPKGQTNVRVSLGYGPRPDPDSLCRQHDRPIAPGYCDRYTRADGRPAL